MIDVYLSPKNLHQFGQVAAPDHFGWMMDGICDGLADVFRFVAFAVVLQRLFSRQDRYTAMVTKDRYFKVQEK